MNAIVDDEVVALEEVQSDETASIPLSEFISKFGSGLLQAVRSQNPPIFDEASNPIWDGIINSLSRTPFPAQRRVVHAITTLLTQHAPAGVINAEMGTGKTLMGILVATLLHHAGFPRTLVLAPPTWFTNGGVRFVQRFLTRKSGSSTAPTRFESCCSSGACEASR